MFHIVAHCVVFIDANGVNTVSDPDCIEVIGCFLFKNRFLSSFFGRNRAWFSVCNKNPFRASIMV